MTDPRPAFAPASASAPASAATPDLLQLDALATSAALHRREFSCEELMRAHLEQVTRLNPASQALVALRDGDELLAEARAADAELAAGRSRGWLHGMPQAIKDMAPVAGLPITLGSPLMRRFVPREDGLMAQRMRAAGRIVTAKTNTPEFGLGSHTFNEVYGTTRNAWNPRLSAGGSSGGAAVALAQRLLCVADGSDFMGSLHNPAAWAHVYGLRPSQGRVPMWPASDTWVSQLGTEGPMGRRVADVRRLLQTQAGYDPRAPLSLSDGPATLAAQPLEPRQVRIDWLADLDGYLAVKPGLIEACEQALARFESLGCIVEPISLGFAPERVWEAWLVWRRMLVASRIAPFLVQPAQRAQIKPEALWEHD